MIREYLNKLKYLRKNIIWLPLQSLNLPKIPDVKGALTTKPATMENI